MKLTRYLLCITGNSTYGDSMERVILNTVLGAKPSQSDGRTFYYSYYRLGAKKVFHPTAVPAVPVPAAGDLGVPCGRLLTDKRGCS